MFSWAVSHVYFPNTTVEKAIMFCFDHGSLQSPLIWFWDFALSYSRIPRVTSLCKGCIFIKYLRFDSSVDKMCMKRPAFNSSIFERVGLKSLSATQAKYNWLKCDTRRLKTRLKERHYCLQRVLETLRTQTRYLFELNLWSKTIPFPRQFIPIPAYSFHGIHLWQCLLLQFIVAEKTCFVFGSH